MTATLLDGPANGTVTLATDGAFTYTPALNFFDGHYVHGRRRRRRDRDGTVTVTVTEVNDAPTAANDSATAAEDGSVILDVRTNDTANEAGQTLTVTAVGSPAHGSAVVLADGTVRYTPAANFYGTDSFTYTVTDNGTTAGSADSKAATATVSVTVTAVADDPTAAADALTVAEDAPATTVDVLANDLDVDNLAGDPTAGLTITAVGMPGHGRWRLRPTVISPVHSAANYAGADVFATVDLTGWWPRPPSRDGYGGERRPGCPGSVGDDGRGHGGHDSHATDVDSPA